MLQFVLFRHWTNFLKNMSRNVQLIICFLIFNFANYLMTCTFQRCLILFLHIVLGTFEMEVWLLICWNDVTVGVIVLNAKCHPSGIIFEGGKFCGFNFLVQTHVLHACKLTTRTGSFDLSHSSPLARKSLIILRELVFMFLWINKK